MHRLPSLLVLTVLLLASVPAEPGEAGWPLVVIVPLGDPAPDLVEHLAASLRARFRMRVQVTKPEPLPQAAWYPPRAGRSTSSAPAAPACSGATCVTRRHWAAGPGAKKPF